MPKYRAIFFRTLVGAGVVFLVALEPYAVYAQVPTDETLELSEQTLGQPDQEAPLEAVSLPQQGQTLTAVEAEAASFDSAPLRLPQNDEVEGAQHQFPVQLPLPGMEMPLSDEAFSSEELTTEQNQAVQQVVILETLTQSANKYPYIINPTDGLTFSPNSFLPNVDMNYGGLDFRFVEPNFVVDRATYARFPPQDQFYWILEGNRVVAETQGQQFGLFHQGQTIRAQAHQTVDQTIALWGQQVASVLPRPRNGIPASQNLDWTADQLLQADILVLSGQVTSEADVSQAVITLNSGLDLSGAAEDGVSNLLPNIGEAFSYSESGGQALFENLTDEQAPLILQGYPTIDIRPLLDNGQLQLQQGTLVPPEVLERAGIAFGNVVTGQKGRFSAPLTSVPGIKVGRLGRFDNLSLLNVLVNPALSQTARETHYLNSLYWTGFLREPEFELVSNEEMQASWYRLYGSQAHNQLLIEYDSASASATYTNLFSNPGISLTVNEAGDLDGFQTLNSTLGLALGGLFELIHLNLMDQALAEARQRVAEGSSLASLNTQATADQRRQMNQRLNQTLAYSTVNSGLIQVSGRVVFPSQITPETSSILRFQTGLYPRQAQVFTQETDLSIGETVLSRVDLSSRSFGPLSFAGTLVPAERAEPEVTNQAFATQIILTSPSGQRYVQAFSSNAFEPLPVGVKMTDLAFDWLEFTRQDDLLTRVNGFRGVLALPAAELTWSGSLNNTHYSLTSGLWLNLAANQAPGVSQNTIGIQEPFLGAYFNSFLTHLETEVERDEEQNPTAVNTFGPTWRTHWESTGDLSTVLSYEYSHQSQGLGWSLRPGVAFTVSDTTEWIALLDGQIGFGSGFSLAAHFELEDGFYYDLRVEKPLSSEWIIGSYLRNYSFDLSGLNQRINNLNGGGFLRHQFSGSNSFFEGRFGISEIGIETQVRGGFQF